MQTLFEPSDWYILADDYFFSFFFTLKTRGREGKRIERQQRWPLKICTETVIFGTSLVTLHFIVFLSPSFYQSLCLSWFQFVKKISNKRESKQKGKKKRRTRDLPSLLRIWTNTFAKAVYSTTGQKLDSLLCTCKFSFFFLASFFRFLFLIFFYLSAQLYCNTNSNIYIALKIWVICTFRFVILKREKKTDFFLFSEGWEWKRGAKKLLVFFIVFLLCFHYYQLIWFTLERRFCISSVRPSKELV